MNKKIYISARGDRYGSNSLPWILSIFLSYTNKYKLYHNCSELCNRYKNNIVHKLLLQRSSRTNNIELINSDLINCDSGYLPLKKIFQKIKNPNNIPFPELFYKSPFYYQLRLMYDKKYKNLNSNFFKKISQETIIYIRLGDVGPINSYNPNYNFQSFFGKEKLLKLIKYVYYKFNTKIYLMGTQNELDFELCRELLLKCNSFLKIPNNKINDYIINNPDIDYDIYLMLICKNLIIGRSTFTFIPAILHKNIVFSEEWCHYQEIFNNSKKIICFGNNFKNLDINIFIIQTDNRLDLDYLLLSQKANKKSADYLNYNYKFIKIDLDKYLNIHPAIIKIYIINDLLNSLNKNDIIIFLDSDAWIHNQDKIKNIIDLLKFNNKKYGCFSRDPLPFCPDKLPKFKYNNTFINSGSFIIKVNTFTINMYKYIIKILNKDKRYINMWPYDQFYISNFILKNKNFFYIFKHDIINCPWGKIIKHNWWKNLNMYKELNNIIENDIKKDNNEFILSQILDDY
tara:strand:- start:12182 stop:13720 length:1539 start_codon:yes stop_codon:yes gene_type:complete